MSKGWAGGTYAGWRKKRLAILARDGYLCTIGLPGCTTNATQVDHIIAKVHGGTDHPGNLRAACRHCNTARGAGPTDPKPSPRTVWG